ncbi:MAG: hypothetical protein AAGE03_10580 [Pseudomonadota bacterium]
MRGVLGGGPGAVLPFFLGVEDPFGPLVAAMSLTFLAIGQTTANIAYLMGGMGHVG